MKILHISRTMGQGGAEKIVFQLCKNNDMHEQFVISNGGIYSQKLNKLGIKQYIMPDINSKSPFVIIKCFFKILYVVKKNKIQVIHAHHRMAAFYARLVSIFTDSKCIYTAHNVFFNKRALLRFSLKKSKIIAVGNGVKDNLVNYYGFKTNQITTIYNTIDISKKGVLNRDLISKKKAGKYLIGTIGRITKQKGIDVFLRAIKGLKKEHLNICGVVVGDGEDFSKMKEMAQNLKINNEILFLGYQENILDVMDQLDLIVLASRWEGLPLTPIEAFSQSKTVIATNITGNNEIIKHLYNGMLFEKDSVEDLINSLKLLYFDDELKMRLEKNARKTFEKEYSFNKFITEYNNVYLSLK